MATVAAAMTAAAPVTAAAAACLGEAGRAILLALNLRRRPELGTLLMLDHALLHPLPGARLALALLVPLLPLHLGAALLHPRHHRGLLALASFELRAHRAFGIAPAVGHLALLRPARTA